MSKKTPKDCPLRRAHVFDHGDKIIAVTGGETGASIEITAPDDLNELRKLIKQRSELGKEIAERLASHGLTGADNVATQIKA